MMCWVVEPYIATDPGFNLFRPKFVVQYKLSGQVLR
jgi:hypothetical protein